MLRRSLLLILAVTFQVANFGPPVFGQDGVQKTNQPPTLSRYFDPKSGMTADEAVDMRCHITLIYWQLAKRSKQLALWSGRQLCVRTR